MRTSRRADHRARGASGKRSGVSEVWKDLAGILRREAGRLEGFLGFVRCLGAQDPETARDLEEFVLGHLDPDHEMEELDLLHAEIEAELGALLHRLTEHNQDLEAHQKLENAGGGPRSPAPSWPSSSPYLGCAAARSRNAFRPAAPTPITSAGAGCAGGKKRQRPPMGPSSTTSPTRPTTATA